MEHAGEVADRCSRLHNLVRLFPALCVRVKIDFQVEEDRDYAPWMQMRGGVNGQYLWRRESPGLWAHRGAGSQNIGAVPALTFPIQAEGGATSEAHPEARSVRRSSSAAR